MKTRRITRQEFLARLAARPSALRLGQFEELSDHDALVALVEQAEGDLSALTAEFDAEGVLTGGELFDLRAALALAYTEARAAVTTAEQVEALSAVAAAVATIDGASAARWQETVDREAVLTALDEQVTGPAAGEPEPEPGEGEQAPAEGDPPAEGEQPPAAPEGDEPAPAEPATAQAAARPIPRRPDLSALALARNRWAPEPEAPTGATGITFRGRVDAAASSADTGRGEPFRDVDHLGESLAQLATDVKVDQPSDSAKHYLGRFKFPTRPGVVLQTEFPNLDGGSLLDEATRRTQALKLGEARKVASGGICVPAVTDISLTTVGERGMAWVDKLPTIEGNRPLDFYQWINMSLRATAGSRVGARPVGGIGTVTAAQDAAGYGGTNRAGVVSAVPGGGHAFKDATRIDCPSVVHDVPEATFKATVVGNFAALTWPEYVATFDEIVGFYFDVYRDERALAKYVAAAKNLTVAGPTFGAARDLLDAIRRLVAHVRSVRKAPGLQFQIDVPYFARFMVAQDIADSWAATNEGLRLSSEQALALLAVDEGIFIGDYGVSIGATADGSASVLAELTDGSALPDWPTEIRILAYPVGGVFHHDYGNLAFGLKEAGMETNDTIGFYETFESTGYRTTDIFTIDVPLCVNGGAGASIAKLCD